MFVNTHVPPGLLGTDILNKIFVLAVFQVTIKYKCS